MKTPATRWSPTADRATKPAPDGRRRSASGVEPLEARIAPAALAALPGNSNFEDTVDFAEWTVSSGPATTFEEYLSNNVETTIVRGALAPEGDAYAHLSFEGRVAPTATGFGPSLQSATFTADIGEQISVVWRATNNGDVAHPRGRLFAADGTPVATFFDADTGTTAFATSTVTVPSAGEYYLRFEAGASDVSVGGLIGAKLDIDAIHRVPSGVTVNTLPNAQLSVEASSESPTSNDPNTFLVTLDDTGKYLEIFVNGSLDFIQPLSAIDRINVLGRGGNDLLTVDSSHGLISLAEGIHFDGGGAVDTLILTQTGASTFLTDVYSVGPNAGEGASQISDGVSSQIVYFQSVEPVLDNVSAASFTVNGSAANDTISSIVGSGGGVFTGATAKISVDGFGSIEFNNKTSLTINSLEGSDTISLNNPITPVGLTSITIQGGDPTTTPGDTLKYLNAGSINPIAAGSGTITATSMPTVNFTGIEVAAVAGITLTSDVAGLAVAAAGDQGSLGQSDAFVIATNAATQFLTLALNGSISLYAHQSAIAEIAADGQAGNDSLTLTGTGNSETLTFGPTAMDAGNASITGVVTVDYTAIESVVLNAMGGDDTFAVGGALGVVKVIGGSGSDRIDFSTAASRVVFDLDAVGVDQFVNATGQVVNLGDVIENFTGSSFNDSLRVNAANFTRDLKGGANSNEVFPPGDELSFDGQAQVVNTTLVDADTGTYRTNGFADVTFDGFESPVIANSPSGPGFGTPGNSDPFNATHFYNLTKSPSGGTTRPAAMATADLNGDGFIDMVIVNSSIANISVLLNLGDGTFGTPTTYKTKGKSPRDIAIGNFNANPGLDLAVTNYASNTLAIFSGDNLGGFSAPTLIKTARNPSAITVGHVDGDLTDDLVITHSALKVVSVLLGTQTGFASAVTYKTMGARPVDVVIGDFNGDGKSDVVTSDSNTSSISFFQGDGLGGLAEPTKFAAGVRPKSLVVADFNLDGILDLAVSDGIRKYISILFSNGAVDPASQFQSQLKVALPGQYAPASLVAADFNNDGIADLGLGRKNDTNLTVLIGSNLGKFSLPYEFDLGKYSGNPRTAGIWVADLNNDGLLDIIATGRDGAPARVLLHKI
jgi:hypothetical protein